MVNYMPSIHRKSGIMYPKKYYLTNHCKCGKLIHRQSKRCRKCQSKRHSNLIKGKNNPNFKHGETLKQKYCTDCGKKIDYRNTRCQSCDNVIKFSGKTYEEIMGIKKAQELKKIRSISMLGKSKSKEHRKKISLSHGGTGVPYEDSEYSSEFYNIRDEIIDRDNSKCQLCNITQKDLDRKLCVHHIDYNKQNFEEENLISLCLKCHLKTNFNRDYWFAYFTEIINRIYQLI